MAQIDGKIVKTLNRLFTAGFISEKEIQSMTVTEMLSINGVTMQDLALISELQRAIKEHCIMEFLTGTKDFSSASKRPQTAKPVETEPNLDEREEQFDERI